MQCAYPLDGLVQLIVNGSPAVAWMPDGGLSMTLLLAPCAATTAAKARTSGIHGRMLIDRGVGIGTEIKQNGSRLWSDVKQCDEQQKRRLCAVNVQIDQGRRE
jgi:hypothetical protein